MALFKKFRMGSNSTSRSISQEADEPVQQPLLTRQLSIDSSNTNSGVENMDINAEQLRLLPEHSQDDAGNSISVTLCSVTCYFVSVTAIAFD